MGRAAHHYLIFDTAGGFCGIAWNSVGITRFQLPTKSAEAAERSLLRRLPGAMLAVPRSEEVGFAHDSALEGDGFELPVPVRQAKLTRSCR